MAGIDVHELTGDEATGAPRVSEELAWLRRNPVPHHAWRATGPGGELVRATYPLRVWIGGREARFVQVLPCEDVAGPSAEPAHVEAAREAMRAHVAAQGGVDGDWVHVAWPTDDAWRSGVFGRFDIVRTQTWLGREPGEGAAAPPEGIVRLERFDHEARWLWDRCAGGFGASTIRDEAFLNWRLFERPGRACRVLASRGPDGVLRGFAAVRESAFLGEPATVVVDWLVPTEEAEAGELLRQAVLAEARAAGSPLVAAMIVEWSPWFDAFQRWGFTVRPSGLFPIARSFVRRFDHLWLRDHWWTTPADTTLV